MATSVGDLAINISTNTATVETAFNKLSDVIEGFGKRTQNVVDATTSRVHNLVDALKTIAAVGIAGVGLNQFADLIEGAIKAQGELLHLSEATGATVESLSAMRDAARYADTDMQAVAKGMEVFARNVAEAQSGTGKQAAALRSLGFNAQTFATQFKSTDQAVLAVAKALDQYGAGLGKTATLQALFGRSGAELAEFLQELATRGTGATKVTLEQARAAKELEDSIVKLKIGFADFMNSVATTLVPILQKVINSIGTFRDIGLAAIAAFVVWPTVVAAMSAALTGYREAALAAALSNEVLGTSISTLGISAQATLASLQAQFLTFAGLMRTLPALIFAGFAGFQLGSFLRDQFVEAKNFGYAFVDSMLTGWEYLKYGAGVAWEAIKLAFSQALENMRGTFASFLSTVAEGLSHVPFLGSFSEQLTAFAATVRGEPGAALATFRKNVDELGATFDANRAKIHNITTDLMAMAIAEEAGAAAAGKVRDKQLPPPPPDKAYRDITSAIDAYIKSLAELDKAYAAASSKAQLTAIESQQAALKRQFDEGIVDFAAYYAKQVALQKQSIDVQIGQAQREVEIQRSLFDSLQEQANKAQETLNRLSPGTKEYASAQGAVFKANAAVNEANAKLITGQQTLNDLVAKGKEIGLDYIEAYLVPASNGLLKLNSDLDKQIATLERQNDEIGLTAAQVAELNVQRVEEARTNAILTGQGPNVIEFYDRQIDRLRRISDLTAEGEFRQKWVDGWRDLFQSAADRGAQFLEDFRKNGSSAFRNLWDDFKSWAFSALAKIAAQTIVVNIAGLFSPQLGGIASNTFGQSFNPFQLLSGASSLSSASSGGGIISGLDNLPSLLGLPSFSTAIGNLGTILPTFSAQLASGAGVFSAASTAFAGTLASFATVALPLIPLAIPLISGLFSKEPSQVKGQFQVSAGTTGFEDNAFVTSVLNGLHLGFADANTQQFSGDAAKAFDTIVSGAIDAFTARYSPAQKDRLAEVLQQTAFPTFEGTFSTEDFIKQYGGKVLREIVVAAFNELDPALASVAEGFSGTADEVASFANTLLSIYDATKAIGSADFTSGIDSALQGADQTVADKILAFVSVVQQFGTTIAGLGDVLEAIDPSKITELVDAFGGVQQFTSTFASFNQNFGTKADATVAATQRLTTTFGNLGLAVPQTHAEFVRVVNDFLAMGNTDAASSVLSVSDAFVTLHGTAQQAADALDQAANAGRDYYSQHFLTPAEQAANRVSVDETALYNATKGGTLLNQVLTDLGVNVIPTSVDGVRALVDATVAKYGADSEEAKALFAVIPLIGDLNDAYTASGQAIQGAAQQVNDAINSISHPVDVDQYLAGVTSNIANIDALANEATGTFGDKLAVKIQLLGAAIAKTQDQIAEATAKNDYSRIAYLLTPQLKAYQQANTAATAELARFTVLAAQYDASRAEQLVQLEDWYAQQKKLFAGQTDVLSAAKQIFDEKWKAIVDGVSTGVDGTLDQLAKLKQGIADYLRGLAVSDLSPLTPTQQLTQAHDVFYSDLAKAQSGDLTALGDITKSADAYLKEARDYFASAPPYTDIYTTVTNLLGDLAGTTPGGLPLPESSAPAIDSHLPTGTLASSDDIAQNTQATNDLRSTLIELFGAHATATTTSIDAGTETMKRVWTTLQRSTTTAK